MVFLMLYFGAIVVPAAYCVFTRFRGPMLRKMLLGAALQLTGSLLVVCYVEYGRRNAYRDYWAGWGLMPLVNLASALFFGALLVQHFRYTKRD